MGNLNKFVRKETLLAGDASKILLPHQFYYPQLFTVADRFTNEKREDFQNYLNQGNDESKEMMIYVHIPFCDAHCSFCSFDKAYDLNEISKYVDCLISELEYYAQCPYFSRKIIKSIHFGGGTPTILPPEQMERIVKGIYGNFNVEKNAIMNIEGSATTLWRKEILDYIKSNNFSRVSVGIQTFDEKTRAFYGSSASLGDVWKTLYLLKNKSIVTYIDVMYGYPLFNETYSDYNRVMKDIETAADIGVDGIEFGQLYPFYNPMEQVIKSRNMQFPGKQELITLIQDATQFMYNHGYTQLTQYGFVHSEGEIILENAYYGKDGKNMDCLALGSGAFGSLGEWKYRNLFYRRYMESKGNRYLQLKHLSKYEMKMSGIVGFPKTLGISKDALERVNDNQPFKDTLQQLLNAEMLEEEERIYTLTRKGKCYIDNIYMALMSEEERKNILKTMKIHIIE